MPVADLAQMRALAQSGFDAAIARANPARAVAEAFACHPPETGARTLLIAVGKAAPAMLRAARQHLPGAEAICVTHKGNTDTVDGVTTFYAGHPVPDQDGLDAAQAVAALLRSAGPDDRVVALLSGGGSALLPAPPPGISLADKQALNQALLGSGLDISAMNTVRQQVSQLKGGGMLRLAAPAKVQAYILSDVIGDDLRAIASGPTVAPLGSRADALRLVQPLAVPQSVLDNLSRNAEAEVLPPAENHLIGGNRQSAEAATQALAHHMPSRLIAEPLVGDVTVAAEHVLDQMAQVATGPSALVWGGETTVQLKGSGLGGRNQELALILATLEQTRPLGRAWVFLSGGTDGRDGPTDAAGGLVDNQSYARMCHAGGAPERLLANNDSHAALSLSGDLLMSGATGTNVADVQIAILL